MGNHIFSLACALASIVVLLSAVFTAPAMAQESANNSGVPILRVHDWLVVQPRAKIQLDFSGFRPELEDKRKVFQARRVRFGADGTFFRDLAYSARVETRKSDLQFRDLFLRYQRLGSLQLQAGRFKIPFGLDQLTDSGELDFVHRSRIGSIVAPGRDTGAMILGNVLEGAVRYSGGIFRHDGRNTEIEDFSMPNERVPGGNRTVAARVTVRPDAFIPVSIPARNLNISAAFTHSDMATGLSSLPGVTTSNQVFFPRMYASGNRMRRGAELSANLGRVRIQGELMDAREQRLGQGLRNQDFPDLRTQGWYVSAVHRVLGDAGDTGSTGLLDAILPGKQLGRIEATARYEVIRFGGVTSDGSAPSRNSRAGNVIGNEDRAWTLGLNWHASRYLKLQFNGVRETLRDTDRSPIEGEDRYWTVVWRIQLYF